jgi:phage-related protein
VYTLIVVEKPLAWLGSSLDDLRALPAEAKRAGGYQLGRVQQGLMPDDWKAMTTVGAGVYEIRIHTGLEHRILYVAKYEEAVYVLHAFEKRAYQTREADIALARKRLSDLLRVRVLKKKEAR